MTACRGPCLQPAPGLPVPSPAPGSSLPAPPASRLAGAREHRAHGASARLRAPRSPEPARPPLPARGCPAPRCGRTPISRHLRPRRRARASDGPRESGRDPSWAVGPGVARCGGVPATPERRPGPFLTLLFSLSDLLLPQLASAGTFRALKEPLAFLRALELVSSGHAGGNWGRRRVLCARF